MGQTGTYAFPQDLVLDLSEGAEQTSHGPACRE
jgi:hypothetical protein